MTIVSRLELDHPPLGQSGGQALWDQVNDLYIKLGDACNPRFYRAEDLANGATVDFDHNYQVSFDQIRWDLYTWDTGTDELTRIFDTSGYSVEATPGNETTQIRVTNNTGTEVDVVLQLFNDPIDLGELENVDLATTPPEDGQALVYDSSNMNWIAGASGDSSFKLQDITGETLTIKSGFLILGSAVELYAPNDLAIDFSIAERQDNGDYVVFIDLAALPDETDLNGRPVRVVTETEIDTVRTSKPYELDLNRQVPIGTVERNLGVLENQQTLATRRHTDDTATISALEFQLDKQPIGAIGDADNIRAGHELGPNSFPSSGDPSYYNLANNGNDNSGNTRNFTDNGTPVYGQTGIKGVAGAVQLNGTDQWLSNTDDFFNPGNTAFTCGGWFNADNFPAGSSFFGQWEDAINDRSYLPQFVNNELDFFYSTDGTDTIQAGAIPDLQTGTWYHFVITYDGSLLKAYLNGVLQWEKDGVSLHKAGTPSFQLGAATSSGTAPFNGRIDEFFFENSLYYSDDDISKIYSHQISHNRNIETASQRWVANLRSGPDHAVILYDFITSMDQDRCWIDLTGQADNAEIIIKMFDDGPLGSTTAVRSMERKVTAAELDAQLPISHRLPTRPTTMQLWTEVIADSGDFELIDSSAYLLANDSQVVSTGTSLASILGNDTRVHLIVSVGASAVISTTTTTTDGNGGEAGINYILNTDAETDATTDTVQVDVTTTEETTDPLIGAQSFRVSSLGIADGYHGWTISTIDNAFIDRTKLKFTGIAKTDGPGWAVDIWNVTDGMQVPGTESELPDNNQASWSVGAVPETGKTYLPRLVSKTAANGSICLADRVFFGFTQTGAADLNGWKTYDETVVNITPEGIAISDLRANFTPIKDSITGKWFLDFTISLALVGGSYGDTSFDLTVDGILISSNLNFNWPFLVNTDSVATLEGFASQNSNVLRLSSQNSISRSWENQNYGLSGYIPLASKPDWADYEPTGVALNNETLNANARARYYLATGGNYTANTTYPFDTEDTTTYDTSSTITNSNGVFEVKTAGTYDINVGLASDNPDSWGANAQLEISVDRGSGFVQERILDRQGAASFRIEGNCSIKLDIGDSFRVLVNDSSTLNPGQHNTYIEINRVADFTSETTVVADLATRDTAGFVKSYDHFTLNLVDNGGQNMNGTLKFVRINDIVTYTSDGSITHDSTTATTSDFSIPINFRPTNNISNCYVYDNTSGRYIIILNDGRFGLTYESETGGVARSDSGGGITGSYVII